MRDTFEMVNGAVTVILGGADQQGKFSFEGVKVSTKPNVLFKSYVHSLDKKVSGELTITSLREHIYGKIKVQADSELKDYIKKHINDTAFYTEKDEYEYKFFSRGVNSKDAYPEIDENINLTYGSIGHGLVNCTINNRYCVYDLVQDKFISIRSSSYSDAVDVTPLQIFYGRELNFIIALEQYKLGKAHPAFTEVVNLNKFLEGKKSVKLKMTNGKVHELKSTSSEVRANQIIECINGVFSMENNYHLSPRLEKDHTGLEFLDCLQFGKQTYKINAANLVIKAPAPKVKAPKTRVRKSKNAAK